MSGFLICSMPFFRCGKGLPHNTPEYIKNKTSIHTMNIVLDNGPLRVYHECRKIPHGGM
jgi:hypothetical protein